MKIRTVIGLAGATAASLVGTAALASSPAGADPGQQIDAASLSAYLGIPGVPVFGPLIYSGEPGVQFSPPNLKVSGNCVSAAPWLFATDPNPNGPPTLFFNFLTGNAHVYRVNGNTPLAPFLPGGLNAEGTAELLFLDPNTGNLVDTGFGGPAHTWLGQNGNANGQVVGAETISFDGTAPDGSTISLTTNPGTITSASGHPSGWGQENLSCNILSAS